jgi:transcriptional regulator with XRE-family HTH domain
MSTSVEILSPKSDAQLQRALGELGTARFASRPSSNVCERMLVAWLSDLNMVHHRRALAELVDSLLEKRGEAAFVLIQTKRVKRGEATPATSGEGLQALVHWTARLGREPYIAPDVHVVRRMILAWQSNAQQQLIASASIERDKLVVWTCEPRRYEVPISTIPSLARMKPQALSNFKVSESGSRIHWDDGDVDLTGETIRAFADPRFRQQQETKHRHEAARYADAIRALREEHGLRQSSFKGLTEREVRRLEKGDTIPRIATLENLASGHDMAVDAYLKALAERSSRAPENRREPKSKTRVTKGKPVKKGARRGLKPKAARGQTRKAV